MATQLQLDELESAYSQGVLKIREGDTWVEYQSMKDMRVAINDMRAELTGIKPVTLTYPTIGKGY